jgi:hypothetical protein
MSSTTKPPKLFLKIERGLGYHFPFQKLYEHTQIISKYIKGVGLLSPSSFKHVIQISLLRGAFKLFPWISSGLGYSLSSQKYQEYQV